ncbi:MAG: glycine cleavage system protein GcvH [Candidatus Edwardsbacteria bacterium]
MFPTELKYTETHEWVRIEDDFATIGITDYAQGELGDIVFVELPAVGKKVKAGQPSGTIEAVKAVSDLVSAVSGEVVEVNSELQGAPDLVNKDCYGKGWMIRLKMENSEEIKNLLTAEQYEKMEKKTH